MYIVRTYYLGSYLIYFYGNKLWSAFFEFFFDSYFAHDRKIAAKILRNLEGSKWWTWLFQSFGCCPPGEAFFEPLKAGNLFISVVATLRFPIKAVEIFSQYVQHPTRKII